MHELVRAEAAVETHAGRRGPIRNLSPFLATLLTCAALVEGNACAQDVSHDAQPHAPSDSAALPPLDTLYRPYDQRDVDEVARQARLLRNILMGTSAAFAVGLVLAGIGATNCKPSLNQGVDCTDAGNVFLPLGATISVLSGVGILMSGIMLGLRNKQKRDIEREIHRRYAARRLHFDEKSGGLVF